MPGAAIALGAAWKGIGLDRDEVNLRLDEFAFRRAFDQVSGRMATLVTLAFIAAVTWVYDLRVRQQGAEKQHVKAILEPAATRFREVWPGTDAEKRAKVAALARDPRARPALLQTFTKAMEAQVQEMTGGKTRKRDPNQRSAFDIWRDWTDALKGVAPKHWIVDKFRIEPAHQSYQVFCEGWLDLDGGRGSLDQMLRAMRAHPMFTDTTPGETKPMTPPGTGEERLKFGLTTKTPDTVTRG